MDYLSKKEIILLLEQYDARPLKKMGQNFLIDKNIIDKIISLVEPDDIVVEVGPGLGSITLGLEKKVKELICIEKDKKMVEILEKKIFPNNSKIKIIKGDILKEEIKIKKKYKVVANVPFYITSPMIRRFLEEKNPPEEMILLIQKEVAKRICSKPPEMNILALSVQFYADPKIIFPISRNSFWPLPNVDSAIINIKKTDRKYDVDPILFFKVLRSGFSRPRAQLLNNISNGLKLSREEAKKLLLESNVNPIRRAETLSLEEWIIISKHYA